MRRRVLSAVSGYVGGILSYEIDGTKYTGDTILTGDAAAKALTVKFYWEEENNSTLINVTPVVQGVESGQWTYDNSTLVVNIPANESENVYIYGVYKIRATYRGNTVEITYNQEADYIVNVEKYFRFLRALTGLRPRPAAPTPEVVAAMPHLYREEDLDITNYVIRGYHGTGNEGYAYGPHTRVYAINLNFCCDIEVEANDTYVYKSGRRENALPRITNAYVEIVMDPNAFYRWLTLNDNSTNNGRFTSYTGYIVYVPAANTSQGIPNAAYWDYSSDDYFAPVGIIDSFAYLKLVKVLIRTTGGEDYIEDYASLVTECYEYANPIDGYGPGVHPVKYLPDQVYDILNKYVNADPVNGQPLHIIGVRGIINTTYMIGDFQINWMFDGTDMDYCIGFDTEHNSLSGGSYFNTLPDDYIFIS